MESGGGRLFGAIFVAVVVIAIAALLLGFGVPVGIGALAGFTLGGLAGLIGVVWLARGPGRSVTFGRTTWSGRSSGGPPDAEIAELRDTSELLQVDLGRVLVVQPVVAVDVEAGLAVQLVAAFVHEGGVRLDLEVRASPGTVMPGHMARVVVSDDIGSTYRAAGQSTGGAVPVRYEVRVIPRPPVAAASIIVRVDSFADPFGPGRRVAGPWTFTVPLSGGTASPLHRP
jgi:hypothetical protein